MIGFEHSSYTVREEDGSVVLNVLVREGRLERAAQVNVSLASGSALGKNGAYSVYIHIILINIIMSDIMRCACYIVGHKVLPVYQYIM